MNLKGFFQEYITYYILHKGMKALLYFEEQQGNAYKIKIKLKTGKRILKPNNLVCELEFDMGKA